jgi:hypothetical protein
MNTREGKLALAWLRYVNDKNDIRGPVTILADAGWNMISLRSVFKDGDVNIPAELKEQRTELLRKRHRVNNLLTSLFDYHGLNNDITHSLISVITSAHSSNMLTVPGMIRLMEKDMKESSKYTVDALLDDRSVMIQTMHKSKGLEYPIVIVGGLRTSVMPSTKNKHGLIAFDPLYGVRMTKEYEIRDDRHRIFDSWGWNIIKNVTGPDKDGERRLFFVALSRAKQYVTMTACHGRESTFFKDICDVPVKNADTDATISSYTSAAGMNGRPPSVSYEKRKERIPLHDIMGAYEESGGGKGTEFGIRVHREAQRIMTGLRPTADSDEIRYILKIRDSVKGAKISSEIDCSLPLGDAVIAGRIDMMAEFADRIEIHDFKTDMNRNNEERYAIQMGVYAHCASSLGKPVRCIIDYVSQGISVNVPVLGIDGIRERLKELR